MWHCKCSCEVFLSQTHSHGQTLHERSPHARQSQCHDFSLISRCSPSLWERPRATCTEKLFVSWLMFYSCSQTDGFHLLFSPHSRFNSSIPKKPMPWSMIISMVRDLASKNFHTSFSPSPSVFQSLQYRLHFFPSCQVWVRKEKKGIFMVIFSVFRTKRWHC